MAPIAKKQKKENVQVPEFRPWAELPPEILGIIFQSFSLEDRLMKLSRVCKSWLRTLKGRYCWKEIDIYSWSCQGKQWKRPQRIERLLRTLIERSGDSFEKLCVKSLLSQDIFILIADNAKNLKTLKLVCSPISDEILVQLAHKLPCLTSLDISCCRNITARGLEAVGRNCKNLTTLSFDICGDTFSNQKSDDLAHSIATTMPKLEALSISKFNIGRKSAMEIITSCKELKSLDITGCFDVEFREKYLENFPGLKVVGPGDENDYGNYSDCGCSTDDD